MTQQAIAIKNKSWYHKKIFTLNSIHTNYYDSKNNEGAVVHEFGKPLTIEELPVKMPGKNEVLVKVTACGVCHTDLHAAKAIGP